MCVCVCVCVCVYYLWITKKVTFGMNIYLLCKILYGVKLIFKMLPFYTLFIQNSSSANPDNILCLILSVFLWKNVPLDISKSFLYLVKKKNYFLWKHVRTVLIYFLWYSVRLCNSPKEKMKSLSFKKINVLLENVGIIHIYGW